MIQSHVIDVDGVFVGAAVRLDSGYRFVATDFRLEELDSTIWPSLADVRRLARAIAPLGLIGPRVFASSRPAVRFDPLAAPPICRTAAEVPLTLVPGPR